MAQSLFAIPTASEAVALKLAKREEREWNPFEHPEHIRHSGRARRLTQLARIYYGKQYDGRPDWWTGVRADGEEPVPLRERKPCRIYKLPAAATKQVVRFLWGEERWPDVRVKATHSGDPTILGGTLPTLNDEEAQIIQGWFADIIDRCGFRTHMRSLTAKGAAVGTAVSAVVLRNGLFSIDQLAAQDCWPRFEQDDPSGQVLELVQCYEFDKEVADDSGRPKPKRYLYRRNWTAGAVWTYPDVPVDRVGDVTWSTPQETRNGLSFCPIVWSRNCPTESTGFDGVSLYADSEDNIAALDFTCSQRYRGIAYLGTPQPVETGVDSDDGPGTSLVNVRGPALRYGHESEDSATAEYSVAVPVRRQGPEHVWSYEGKQVNVSLLETSGKSYEVASLHVRDIRSELLEEWGVVLTNMTDTVGRVATGNEMSGRFLELAHAPLLALIGEYRDYWWRGALEKILQMCLRICVELGGKGILIPASDTVAKIGKRFFVDVAEADGTLMRRWIGPLLEPAWGRYFTPDDTEVKTAVDAAGAANTGRLVTRETALRYVAQDFGVHDIAAELDRIDSEESSAADEAERQQQAEMQRLHDLAGSESLRGRTGADQAQGTGDGSGIAVAAPETVEERRETAGGTRPADAQR